MNILTEDQKVPHYRYFPPRSLNFFDIDEQQVFAGGNYYLKYAIGIYGWPIHVFMNPCTCICKLCCSASCRRQNPRANGSILFDNCLMTNTAALKQSSGINEDDILFSMLINDVRIIYLEVIILIR